MEGVEEAQTVIGLRRRLDRGVGVEEVEEEEEEGLILVPGRTLVVAVVVERPLNGPGQMG